MGKEKHKVDVSNFIASILDNDAQRFRFVDKKLKSNIGGFLNKLIPNLLTIRKLRRELMNDELNVIFENHDKNMMVRTKEYLSTLIDKIYFTNEDDDLDEEIWIRPNKGKEVIFEQIEEQETEIAQLTMPEVLRGLLIEYCRLPQYKREQIAYYNELDMIIEELGTGNVIRFEYYKMKFNVIVHNHIIEYLQNQGNFILCYDIINENYLYCNLTYISKIYKTAKTFEYTEEMINTFNEIIIQKDKIREFTIELRGDEIV